MFVEVYGSEFSSANNGFKLFEKIELLGIEDPIDVITSAQFVQLINRNIHVLIPAFQIQSAIQNKVMGKKFWSKLAKKRQKGMSGTDWLKNSNSVATKVDSKAILRQFQHDKENAIVDRMKEDYSSKLAGRLGEYNPEFDTERREFDHKNVRNLNFESFEVLAFIQTNRKVPQVLVDRKPPEGYTTVPPIATSTVANLGRWEEGSYTSLSKIKKDAEEIRSWQQKIVDSKPDAEVKDGAPEGYEYKDKVESGPVLKIKVDMSHKLVDWTKVKVRNGNM